MTNWRQKHAIARKAEDENFDMAKAFERALRELVDAADGVDVDLQPAVEKARELLNDYEGWDK